MTASKGLVVTIAVVAAAALGIGVYLLGRDPAPVTEAPPPAADSNAVAATNATPGAPASQTEPDAARNAPGAPASTDAPLEAAAAAANENAERFESGGERLDATFADLREHMPPGVDPSDMMKWHDRMRAEPKDAWAENATALLSSYLPGVLMEGTQLESVQCTRTGCEAIVMFERVGGMMEEARTSDVASTRWIEIVEELGEQSWWESSGFGTAEPASVLSSNHGLVLIAHIDRARREK